MKKSMAIGVALVLLVLPSMLLAQEYVGSLGTPDGMRCDFYYVKVGQYVMVFPYTGQSFGILVTLHGPRVVVLIAEDQVFSGDPPYDVWTWHRDAKDEVLSGDSFGHMVCGMIAEHFLKARQVV